MAILTDGNPNFRPSEYEEKGILCQNIFRFGMVKLLDYQDKQRWEDLVSDPNPFALVTMAQLKVLELKGRKRDRERLEWKVQLTRLLEERQLPLEIADDIFDFSNDVVQLPEDLEEEYFNQVTQQEASMPHVTAFERIAMSLPPPAPGTLGVTRSVSKGPRFSGLSEPNRSCFDTLRMTA